MDLSTAEGWTYKIITENSPQEPDKNKVWIGLTYLPDVPDVVTLGDGGEDDIARHTSVRRLCSSG